MRRPIPISSATTRGMRAINQQQPIGWRTYHSIQIAVNRRFRDGLLFGFNDTIGLSDKQNAALRLQHNADGTITTRADQAKADELLGDNHPQTHLMRAQFVWELPRHRRPAPARARLHPERLEPLRHLVGRVGPGLRRHRRLPERRRQREPHRLTRFRAARPRRRRSGRAAAATIRCGSSTPPRSWGRSSAAMASSPGTAT